MLKKSFIVSDQLGVKFIETFDQVKEDSILQLQDVSIVVVQFQMNLKKESYFDDLALHPMVKG